MHNISENSLTNVSYNTSSGSTLGTWPRTVLLREQLHVMHYTKSWKDICCSDTSTNIGHVNKRASLYNFRTPATALTYILSTQHISPSRIVHSSTRAVNVLLPSARALRRPRHTDGGAEHRGDGKVHQLQHPREVLPFANHVLRAVQV